MWVLGLGAVSWAWSEVGFWAHFRADDNPGVWVLTWLLYALAAGVVARVLLRFPARTGPALVLAGALYGWLVEGVVAATVYLALPLSLVWTGVAWHGLLTVVVGWFALPRALRAGGVRAVTWSAGVGIAWGLWSAAWWGAPPDDGQVAATPEPASYALFVVVVSAAAAAGYALLHAARLRPGDLRSRRAAAVALLMLGAWGVLVVVLALPWAPLLLGALVWLVWQSLRRLDGGAPTSEVVGADGEPVAPEVGVGNEAGAGTGAAADGDGTAAVLGFDPGVPWRRLGPFAALPLAAIATYAALSRAAPDTTGSGPFYVGFAGTVGLLTVAGSAALGWALWSAWRPRRSRTGERVG